MPSFWKRGALAALIAAGMAGASAQAQQSSAQCATAKCVTPPCGQAQTPPPGWQPHSPGVSPQTPTPWMPTPTEPIPTDPSQVPAPPETPTTPMPSDTTPPMPTDPSTPTPPSSDPSTPTSPTTDPSTTPPVTPPPTNDPLTPSTNLSDLSFGSAQAGIGSPDVAFSGSPNMMGDLLRAYRGVTFNYLQAGDFAVTTSAGAVNFRNSKVAENNSAIPRDRISYRYNYFKNAIQVRGLQDSPVLGNRFFISSNDPVPQQRFFQFNSVQPASRDYNVQLHTLGLEKTFLDDLGSIEIRIPFAQTLDSNLDLVSGVPISAFPGVVPAVQPTPGQTLGQSDTELQDMNLILKAVLMRDPSQRWTVSGGVGVTIPTGNDINVRTVDYSNNLVVTDRFFNVVQIDPEELFVPPLNIGDRFIIPDNAFAFDQRTRQFQIKNQTWGIAPYLAAAAQPSDRTFLNGFVQIDVPLNSSDWSYRETDIDLDLQARGLPATQFDNVASGQIDDQVLLHLDVGGGYWIYQNPCAHLLRGVAALAELHYTTTLDDADIVIVPETPVRTTTGGTNPDGTTTTIGPLGAPRLGNIANRVDFLNLTLGSQIVLGQHATLATGYVIPLRDDLDRTFDGELNVQLNLYR